MAKSRQRYSVQDPSLSPTNTRTREDDQSRWTEYLGPDMTSPVAARSTRNTAHDGQNPISVGSLKGLNVQWVYQLIEVADGLMAKIYRLNQILDYPDPISHVFSEAFWKAGVFPNHPRICILLSKKFPEHFSKLQLERVRFYLYLSFSLGHICFVSVIFICTVINLRCCWKILAQVDKIALDAINDSAELYIQSLEPWVQVGFGRSLTSFHLILARSNEYTGSWVCLVQNLDFFLFKKSSM